MKTTTALDGARQGRRGVRDILRTGAVVLFLLASPALAQITVTSATYGSNIATVPRGNATSQLVAGCNGKMACGYTVWYYVFGDVAPGKAKDFRVDWSCAGDTAPHFATAPAEAGYGSVVSLACTVPTPTPAPGSGFPNSDCVRGENCFRIVVKCVIPSAACPTTTRYVRGHEGMIEVGSAVVP